MSPFSTSVDSLSSPPEGKNGESGITDSDSDIDSIFGPSTTTEKMVKFCPKPRIKNKTSLAKPSKPGASEVTGSAFPDVANTSYPVDISVSLKPCFPSSSLAYPTYVQDLEKRSEFLILNHSSQSERGELQQGTDLSYFMESLEDNSLPASTSEIMSKFGSKELVVQSANFNLDSKDPVEILTPCFDSVVERSSSRFHANNKSAGILDVPMKSIDDGINAPLSRTNITNSEETLNFSIVDALDESLYKANDLYEQMKLTEQMKGKFQPIPCSKSKKHILASSGATETYLDKSRASEMKSLEGLSLGSSTMVNSARKTCNYEVHDVPETAISSNSALLDKNEGTLHIDCRNFGEASEVVSSLETVDASIQQTSITGASGPPLNLSTSSSQTVAVSSELEMTRDSFIVTKGFKQNVEASQVTETYLNSQIDSSKLQKEESTVSSVMESPDDVFLQSDVSTSTAKQKGKYQPKRSLLIKEGKKTKSVSFILPHAGESAATAKCQSELSVCNPTEKDPSFLEMMSDQFIDDSLSSLANCLRPSKVDHGGSAQEDAKESSDPDTLSQLILNSDLHLDKFQPKFRAAAESAETSAGFSPDAAEFGSSRSDSLPTESNVASSATIRTRPSESISCQLGSLPAGSDSLDACDSTFLSGVISFDMIDERACDGNDKLGGRTLGSNELLHILEVEQERDVLEESMQPNLEVRCTSYEKNAEVGKSPMKRLRRNKMKSNIVDKIVSDDEGDENIISGMDEEDGDDEYRAEDRPKKRQRASKKSNGMLSKQEKETKSPKVSEKSNSMNKAPQKKRLLHGSQHKSSSRQVNKALLEVPFDELDRSQVILRDLIRLADVKERTSNKIAAVFKSSLPNQSNSFAKNNVNEENYSSEEQRQEPTGEEENENIHYEAPKLNYHSYMKRPQQTRWSKTDTELFYQAVRQFGTDFAMIQVLFPTRSREQVKAKFKNEQHKHPMQIADALVYRCKDHSHFEKVIQHLQSQAELKAELVENSNPTTNSRDEADNNEEEGMEPNKTGQEVNGFARGQELRHPKMNDSGVDFSSPNKMNESVGICEQDAEGSPGTEKLMVVDL